ncbi:hypothetical protein ASZ90_005494 [hydrocarbon metagenome]|uniref:Lipoprotein n=1 Tax=hydrocarbon metagenome TaxID=938273 RepID=A0A0W8FUR8_9ZZZZ
MKFSNLIKIAVAVILSGIFISGCSYSFTGASIPPHLNSIAIPLSDDRSGSGEPNLREDFTNELITKFIDDNSFQLRERTEADAILESTVLSISDAPSSVGTQEGIETVDSRRITITVKVIYRDFIKKATIFEQNFSNYGDYVNEGDITINRNEAIQEAIDKITEDILLAVVSNW